MAGRVIGLISCAFCAIPFLIIAASGRKSAEPLGFFSGGPSLVGRIRDVKAYNAAMARVYLITALVFFMTGLCYLALPFVATVLIVSESTLGVLVLYLFYKRYLRRYSVKDAARPDSR